MAPGAGRSDKPGGFAALVTGVRGGAAGGAGDGGRRPVTTPEGKKRAARSKAQETRCKKKEERRKKQELRTLPWKLELPRKSLATVPRKRMSLRKSPRKWAEIVSRGTLLRKRIICA